MGTYNRRIFIHLPQKLAQTGFFLGRRGGRRDSVDRGRDWSGVFGFGVVGFGQVGVAIAVHLDVLVDGCIQGRGVGCVGLLFQGDRRIGCRGLVACCRR